DAAEEIRFLSLQERVLGVAEEERARHRAEDEERRGPGEQAEREERPADGLGEPGGPREERRRGKAHRGDALDEAGRGRELAEAVVIGEREAGQEAEHEEAGVGEGAGPAGAADEEALVGG